MLDAIRKHAKGWVAMILIGLLVISFALWGVADVFTGYGANAVASVGDKEIDIRTFQRAYEAELRGINQRLGTPLTNQQAMAFGIPTRVLGRLTTEATIEEVAAELQLGLSSDRLAGMIQSDPSLRGPTGTFDRAMLQRALGAAGLTENEYVVSRRKAAIREQLAKGLVGEMTVPSAYMEAFNTYQNEVRDADYAVLSATDLPALVEPSDDELRSFFDANTPRFKSPEFRSFHLLVVDPASVADPSSVSDEDAMQEYEQTKETRYGAPERRNFQQLPFADAAAAAEAAAKIASGTGFDAVVEAQGKDLKNIEFGLKARSEIIDNAIGDAVFALPSNGVSGVVEGRFGNFILRVTDIRPGAILPFDEVKDQIKKEIAGRNAETEIFRLYDEIEDARAGGADLQDIAGRFSLKVRDVKLVDQSGKTDGGVQADLPEQAELLAEVFRNDVGEESEPIQLARRGFAWFEVSEIVPESERTFEVAKDRVAEAWKADKTKTQLDEKAAEIIAAVKAGGALQELLTPLGVDVAKAEGVSRSTTPEGVLPALAAAMFEGPEGHAGAANGEDAQQRIVFKVTSASEPAYFEEAEGNSDARQQLATALQETVMLQYLQKAQADLGVTVNNQALSYVLGLNGEGQGQL